MNEILNGPHWVTIDGLSDYQTTLDLMEQKLEQVINKTSTDTIYLTEHSEVYTAGTSAKSQELLQKNEVPVIYTGRGGKFTYHGPGQRVIYPVIDLATPARGQDLRLYIRLLQQWIINSLKHLGVDAYSVPDRTGVWVQEGDTEAKIAAIGVRVRKWVAYHGVAVNISTNLRRFSAIIPCGLANFPVTSLKQMGIEVELKEFDNILILEFDKLFA